MILRELALTYMRSAGRVLPLMGDSAPVGHLVKRGFEDATDDVRNLWWFDHNDTEKVGLVPASMGFIVLDVDVKHGANGPANLEALATEHGGWEIFNDNNMVVKTPSGGYHIYLLKPDRDEVIGNHDICKGVNVRSDHGYVVAPGNMGYETIYRSVVPPHPPVWVMKRLRDLRDAQLAEALEDPYSAPEARLELSEEWPPKVHEALAHFDHSDRHTTMLEAVARLASYELLGYAGSTRALMILEDQFIRAVADRSPEGRARAEYRRALDGARHKVRANVSVGLEERDKDRAFVEQIILEHGGTEADVEKVLEQHPSELRLWTMRELMGSDLSLNWLVRSVLVSPTYGQVAGSKKTLKTYLSQYLAIAIATGERFLGQFEVEKQGNVLMFVGEGGRIPWARRMPRIAQSVGIKDISDVPIHAVFQTAPLLSPQFKATVERSIERLDPVLTIIDPFYAFHGSETNSANIHEEGALLTAAAAPFVDHGSTLLIVNHFKKGSENRGLDAITMAGSGEWVDSWVFTGERATPNLNTGDFFIAVEFGSRQWGGSRWEWDINIGTQNPMNEEPETPIQFELRRSYQ